MDAVTGRVLYEKNGYEQMPMASTTKIMTCIVALEYGNLNETVTVSSYAASMPKVKLGIRNGEQFILRDLLYSLMLESHNDVAVAIAEHVAGSVEEFAALMNQKARDIGAYNTNFVTPNGLDATGHYTTAADLALIGAYAIRNSKFVEITNTATYTFSNNAGTRTFNVSNKNSFLNQMEGAFGVKTGYTGKAGYCFVGALKKDGKILVSTVLASGWPPNKTNKWSDTKKLMNYGLSNYSYEVIFSPQLEYKNIYVKNGKKTNVTTYIADEINILLNKERDVVEVKYSCPEELNAPIIANQTVGFAEIYLNGELFRQVAIRTYDAVEKIDFKFCFDKMMRLCVP
ncbi:MAG: D-alanyl-D-alanine carboxypeptidase [Lachnospiraceae bacterium]|nr:D-alanyl-D-alanine carboxypeptidase [Lachnospiraceae bacterium]